MKISKILSHLVISFLILNLWVSSAYAFELTPSVVEFAPEGRGATQKYNIYNSLPDRIEVEVSAVHRDIDENGKETLTPTKDFNIYPRLFELMPGEARVIKATYIGEKKINVEKAYRILAEQLTIEKKKKQRTEGVTIALNFLFKYETSAYVVPAGGAEPNVDVAGFKLVDDEKDAKHLEVDFVNKGTGHQVFQKWNLDVTLENGKSVKLSKKDIKNFPEFNLLAGRKIKVKIPVEDKLKEKPKSVEFKIDSDQKI